MLTAVRMLICALVCGLSVSATPLMAQTSDDAIFWESIRDSKNSKEFEAYLQAFPDGKFRSLANIKLQRLKENNPTNDQGHPPVKLQFVSANEYDFRLTKGDNVNIYAAPDKSSKVRAIARMPLFVELKATSKDSRWAKVRYFLTEIGYLPLVQLEDPISDPDASKAWQKYSSSGDGNWFQRAYTIKLRFNRFVNAARRSSTLSNWNGLYVNWVQNDDPDTRPNDFDDDQCRRGTTTINSDSFLSSDDSFLSDFLDSGELSKVFYVEKSGQTLKTHRLRSDEPDEWVLGKGSFSSSIKTDHRGDRRFRKFGRVKKADSWFVKVSWFNLSDRSLATAQHKPYGSSGSETNRVFNGLYRCELEEIIRQTNENLYYALSRALSRQPGLTLNDAKMFKPGKNGNKLDNSRQWKFVAAHAGKLETTIKTKLPDDKRYIYSFKDKKTGESKHSYIVNINSNENTSCAISGCKLFDIIVEINGKPISEFRPNENASEDKEFHRDIYSAFKSLKMSEKINLTVSNDGELRSLNVTNYTRFEIFKRLLAKSAEGDAEANLVVAQFFDSAWDGIVAWEGQSQNSRVDEDDLSINWYRTAAEGGSVEAMTAYGKALGYGWNTPGNHKAAIRWYRKAIDEGDDVTAMNELADLYLNGEGTEKSVSDAIGWYEKAARRAEGVKDTYELKNASMALAKINDEGKEIPRNIQAAIKWYQIAADADGDKAKLRLADIYLDGDGVDPNYEKALKLVKGASKYSDGFYRIALMTDKGLGLEKNVNEAAQILYDGILNESHWFSEQRDAFKNFIDKYSPELRRKFQIKLKKAGLYKGAIDGAFGKGTMAAVEKLAEKE